MTAPQPTTPTLSPLGEQALAHARDGWAVFPLRPNAKTPLTPNGFKDATRDEAQIRAWWTRHSDANIGGATGAISGRFVVDEDGPEGKEAFAALSDGRDAATRTVTTGRAEGGRHSIYVHPGSKVTSRPIASKVDVKGDGGYVVLPGSIHPSGAQYRVERDAPVANAPVWLLAVVQGQMKKESVTERSTDGWLAKLIAEPVRVGEANNRLTQIIGRLARMVALNGGDLDMLRTLAYGINERFVERPDDGGWLDDCCARMWKKETDKGAIATVDPAAAFQLLTWEALDDLTPPEWLVDDVLPTDAFVLLWGEWGAGKTFLALDLALSVATGKPWHGKTVKQGPAVYVAGEGVRGLNLRRVAWAAKHNADETVPDFYVLPSLLPMLDAAQVNLFADQIEATVGRSPALLVIDTLARCTPGGDENAQVDMNKFVGSVDAVRRRFPEAAVLVLHHPSRAGHLRGSTVLPGAADAILKLVVDEEKVVRTLSCDKMKDAADFEPLFFRLEPVEESCVLMPADAPVDVTPLSATRTKLGKQILEALRTRGPCSFTDWRGAAGASKSSFQRYVDRLSREGLVVKDGDTYRLATADETTKHQKDLDDVLF